MFVFLRASTNNRASTVLQLFNVAITQFGRPSRIRVDDGGENSLVCHAMEAARGPDRASVIRGPSVHNQRIERSWVDVWAGVSNLYYSLFMFLEEEGILNINTEDHMFALHYVFLPRINRDIDMFVQQWNNHGLRTEQHRTPLQLFVGGILDNCNSDLTAIRDVIDSVGHHNSTNPGGDSQGDKYYPGVNSCPTSRGCKYTMLLESRQSPQPGNSCQPP